VLPWHTNTHTQTDRQTDSETQRKIDLITRHSLHCPVSLHPPLKEVVLPGVWLSVTVDNCTRKPVIWSSLKFYQIHIYEQGSSHWTLLVVHVLIQITTIFKLFFNTAISRISAKINTILLLKILAVAYLWTSIQNHSNHTSKPYKTVHLDPEPPWRRSTLSECFLFCLNRFLIATAAASVSHKTASKSDR